VRRVLAIVALVFTLILTAIAVRAGSTQQDAPCPDAVSGSEFASADHWIPYGTAYVWSTDFSDLASLRTRLQYVHSLGVHALIQRHTPDTPLSERRRFLDEAHALGMRVIVRLSGVDSRDPPWGWDGTHFDLTPLETFLGEGMANHPALLAIYGFHIPWDDFTPDEIQQFYTEFHQVAGDIPLYHDLVWVNETPDSALHPGMCDLCEISSMPHTWLDGQPANNDRHVTEKIVRYASHIRQADPNAQIWIQAQTFQRRPDFRMPTADDMLWHADLLMQHVDLDGLLWYPYEHSYEHQLGDDDMEPQRQAVHIVYVRFFWPHTDTYLPLLIR